MTLDANELFKSTTYAAKLRFYPAPQAIKPRKFKNVALGPTLAVGTPVAYDTSTNNWVVWAQAGTNEANLIKGFVWPDPIVLHATNEMIGNVMIMGSLHRADVVLPVGETSGNLDAALQDKIIKEQGFIVEGLPKTR